MTGQDCIQLSLNLINKREKNSNSKAVMDFKLAIVTEERDPEATTFLQKCQPNSWWQPKGKRNVGNIRKSIVH